MEFFINWMMISLIVLIGAMSPGPDFVVTVRNSIVHSRKAGLFTAIGITLGICVHMSYCILGIATLIAQSVVLFSALKWAGAAYLIYIGYKCLRSGGFADQNGETALAGRTEPLDAWSSLRSGFFTNLLNPKATMFFLALFTQVINPHTPFKVLLLYAITVIAISIVWWSFVAFALTGRRIKSMFLRFSKWIDRVCGGLMIAFGLKLVLTRAAP